MPAVDEHGRNREPPPPRLRVELAEFPLARAGLGRGVGLAPNALVDREGVVGVVLAGIPEELAAAAHERALVEPSGELREAGVLTDEELTSRRPRS
jgi:hypothetical protein